mgnify:CR=1 FL=1
MKYRILLSGLAAMPVFGALEFKDEKGKYLDVVSGGKVLVRYMYEHDTTDKTTHHNTYKPYLHVFDRKGRSRSRRVRVGSLPITVGFSSAGVRSALTAKNTIAGI